MPQTCSVPLRGAMECFYGRPWMPEDREAIIRESARWGMNCFVYGPSGDRRTGAAWRSAYPSADVAGFGRLSAIAADVGVSLCWRVSVSSPLEPSRGIVFSDAEERRRLLQKVDGIIEAGFQHILLTFDDVENGLFHARDRSAFADAVAPAAAAHALLAAELFEHLTGTGVRLVVCPTLYWGAGSPQYLRALDDLLPHGVPLCWTGPQVTSRVIDMREFEARYAGSTNRPVWLWDNYPVNDWDGLDAARAAPAERRIFLEPLTGRDAELTTRIEGYFVNCGPSALVNLPAIAAAARWAADAGAYDPQRAIQEAVSAYDDGVESLAYLRTTGCSTPLASRIPHPLVVRGWAFLGAPLAQRRQSGPALGADMLSAASRAEAAARSAAPVVRSARWYAEELALQFRAAAQAVAVLTAEAAGDDTAMTQGAEWLAQRRDHLDGLMRTAALDGGLLALIETGRSLAGAPIPPHDV